MYHSQRDEYLYMKDVFGPIIEQIYTFKDKIIRKQLPSPSTSSGTYLQEPWSVECMKCWKQRLTVPLLTSPISKATEVQISFGGDYEGIVQALGIMRPLHI